MEAERNVYSVKQINHYIKLQLENNPNLRSIWVRGEISNFTLHRSGHMYFSIKDEGSVMPAVMYKGDVRGLRFVPKNGDKVVFRGNITVYEPNGKYQLTVQEMEPDGLGNLHIAFEKLKTKLRDEGLFNEVHKRTIPSHPKTIGVITSPTGAALHDILTTLKRRYPLANIVFLPVLVQGENAPASIIRAIKLMNEYKQVDTLIVGRGGGSIEDLWAFNDEKVARAIFASEIPIISAVGHETDVTISDYVSDERAPTPTAAAELATPHSVSELRQSILAHQHKSKRELNGRIVRMQDRLNRTRQQLQYFHPKKVHETQVQRHDLLYDRMVQLMRRAMERKHRGFELNLAKLEGLSPLRVMGRGYSTVYKEGKLVKSVQLVSKKDQLAINLSDGTIHCTVDAISERGKGGFE